LVANKGELYLKTPYSQTTNTCSLTRPDSVYTRTSTPYKSFCLVTHWLTQLLPTSRWAM